MRERIKKHIEKHMDPDHLKEHIVENKKFFVRITDTIADHIIRSIIMLFILGIITVITSFVSTALFLFFSALLSLFSLLIAISLLRRGVRYLFYNEGKLYQMIIGYAIAVLGIIFLFTTIYSASHELGYGYLTYGTCSNAKVNHAMIADDAHAVNSFGGTLYFTSVTFFTIGYGDICPMGLNKGIAVLNGFAGSVFATIILGIAIARYLDHTRDEERKKKENEKK